MKVTILKGSEKSDSFSDSADRIINDVFHEIGSESITLDLCEITISYCRGCFGCWIKTPGICVIDDPAREIAKKVIQSDLLVYLTPVTFGGYSSELKKILDRMICLISPFFMMINGEVHHKPRYKHFPRLLALGVLNNSNPEEERIFSTLVNRNAINMHSPAYAVGFLLREYNDDKIRKKVDRLLKDLGVSK